VDEDAGFYLGFRRLAIVDLSEAGSQPMVSESGRYVMAFNGEVYNHLEIKRRLKPGRSFRGHSDSETILAAFEEWGPARAVETLRGMFGIALYDRQKRELWLFRDRLGIKPLYVAMHPGGVVFGSELRALLEHPAIDRVGDPEAAWHYLRTLYVPAPLSMIRGVEKVMPGTWQRFSTDNGRVRLIEKKAYWSLLDVSSRPAEPWSENEALERLHDVLRDSVRMRLVADVPVGALLSGGIDSSLIVGLMAEAGLGSVRTFTVSFEDPRFDEGPMAAAIASHLGTDHTEVSLPTSTALDLVPDLADFSDEPMANPSLLPTLLVSRVAREYVTVALAGDGGDELFGGYNRYVRAPSLIARLAGLPEWMRAGGQRALEGLARQHWIERLGPVTGLLGITDQHALAARLDRLAGLVGAGNAGDAYDELMAVGLRHPPIGAHVEGRRGSRGLADLDRPLAIRMMLRDQLDYLPDDLLTKVDRASMWASLEVRVPLLDHVVVEDSWRLPDHMKIRGATTKWALRQLAFRHVPKELLDRPKMGFTVPIEGWLREGLDQWLGDNLSPATVNRVGALAAPEVGRLLSRFRSGEGHLALPLWTAAVLHDWSELRGVSFPSA
jgi:asparagine synthase (glutamine-hydrolysing)